MRSACRLSACTPRNRRCQRRHWCRALLSACWCTRRSSFTYNAVFLIPSVLTVVNAVAIVFTSDFRSHFFVFGGAECTLPVGDGKLRWLLQNFELF